MAGLKQTRANAILEDELGVSPAANRWIGLMQVVPTATTAGTECSGTDYARQPITFGGAASGSIANNNAPDFGAAGAGGWGTANGWCIFDAVSGGNQITFDDWTPFTVNAGDSVEIDAGDIVCQLS